jgi:ABC-type thiamin/hydroxymethylpyrimidine transport system permease subunit
MKTNWEKRIDRRTVFCHLGNGNVTCGEHFLPSGHGESAGAVTYADFLAGKYQDLVLRDFGAEVLAEVIAAVEELMLAERH